MPVVRDFLGLIMMVFNVCMEARMVEGKTMFDIYLESGVESLPYWLKTSDDNNVKKGGSYHPTGGMKCIGWSLP